MSDEVNERIAVPAGDLGSAFSIDSFRGTRNLTKWLKVLLTASLVLDAFTACALASRYLIAESWRVAVALAPYLDEEMISAAIFAQSAFAIVLIIIFSYWIYRTNQNSHRLGASGMRFSPAWAVGWFFVPIANFWKPYQVMQEIWQTSVNPAQWQSQRPGAVLQPWWLFFIASYFFVIAAALSAEDLVFSASTEYIFDILSNGVSVVATYFAIKLIGQVSDMQTNRASELAFT